MQRLEVSGAVRPIYGSLGVKTVNNTEILCITLTVEHNYILLSTVGNKTTTCFGPIGGPSSGCNLDLEISYTRCVGGGGTRSRYFNIGYHDLGFFFVIM